MYVLASENAGHAAQAVADPGIVDILLWGVLPLSLIHISEPTRPY